MEAQNIILFVCIGLGMFAVIGGLAMLSNYYTLNGIKSRTVGDGQHGTARFARKPMLMFPMNRKSGDVGKLCQRSRDWW